MNEEDKAGLMARTPSCKKLGDSYGLCAGDDKTGPSQLELKSCCLLGENQWRMN